MTHEICPVCNDGLVKKEILIEDYGLPGKMDSMTVKVARIEQHCDRCGTTLMTPALMALNVAAKQAAKSILEEFYYIRKSFVVDIEDYPTEEILATIKSMVPQEPQGPVISTIFENHE